MAGARAVRLDGAKDAEAGGTEAAGGLPLDGLLRRAASIAPDRPALSDAPNRAHLIGGAPRSLTWAELDGVVDRLAGRLRDLGCATDTVIATQFPLASDALIALLAISRAGLIAAPIPLGWGRRETVAQLQRIGARAVLTAGRAGPLDCADLMRHAAAEVFSVRFVLSIGGPALDGVVPLDDLFALTDSPPRVAVARSGDAAAHVVLVTAEASPAGQAAVARSHAQVIAGGLAAFAAGNPDGEAVIAATLAPDTFAGIALQVVPWLMGGAHLIAHPPLALRVLAETLNATGTTHVVAPAALAGVLAATAAPTLRHVALAVRTARHAEALAGVTFAAAVDAFLAAGESALIPMSGGAIPLGKAAGLQGAVDVETGTSAAGTLLVRGAMVPQTAFPPGAERGDPPVWHVDGHGFHETGLAVAFGAEDGTLILTGGERGLIAVGGRRFCEADIRAAYAEAGGDIAPVVKPDPVLGERVAGVIGDGRAIQGLAARLVDSGLTPLGIPGGTRRGGPLPFQDTNRPEGDALAGTQAVLEQLLQVAKAAARR